MFPLFFDWHLDFNLFTTDSCDNIINDVFRVLIQSQNNSLVFVDGYREIAKGVNGMTPISLLFPSNTTVGRFPLLLSSTNLTNTLTINYNVRAGMPFKVHNR